MPLRFCIHVKPSGEQCRAAPMHDNLCCFWHAADHTQDVAEAGRLGGLRRKREKTVASAFAFEGIASAVDIRRLMEIAILDALGLDNSLSRSRTLGYLAMVGIKLLEVGDHEARLAAIEAAVRPQRQLGASVFDAEPDETAVTFVPEEGAATDTEDRT